jgi:hypothetical protein
MFKFKNFNMLDYAHNPAGMRTSKILPIVLKTPSKVGISRYRIDVEDE